MSKLNILLIPDGNRRYAKREHLASVLSERGNLTGLLSSKEVTCKEERIRRFMQTGKDPFYDAEDAVDYLKDLATEAHFLARAYEKGAVNIDAIVRYVLHHNLASAISIYGLQPKNSERKGNEIDAILRAEIGQFDRWSLDAGLLAAVKFKFVGDITSLEKYPEGNLYLEAAKKLESSNEQQSKKLDIYILAPYDVKWEINQAIKDGSFEESRLIVPTVDLVIRTSNEKRISEAVPIQARNAEYVFLRQYFPDFNVAVFESALAEFHRRERRFGR